MAISPPSDIGDFTIGVSPVGGSLFGPSPPLLPPTSKINGGIVLPSGATGGKNLSSLFLNKNWDLDLDANGDLAIATDPYSIAQDVASSCRLFQGELWYDTSQGIPYFQEVFGQLPPLGFLAAKFAATGETVPGVDTIAVTLNPVTNNRTLTGTLTITNTAGETATITASVGNLWYVQAIGQQDYGT